MQIYFSFAINLRTLSSHHADILQRQSDHNRPHDATCRSADRPRCNAKGVLHCTDLLLADVAGCEVEFTLHVQIQGRKPISLATVLWIAMSWGSRRMTEVYNTCWALAAIL